MVTSFLLGPPSNCLILWRAFSQWKHSLVIVQYKRSNLVSFTRANLIWFWRCINLFFIQYNSISGTFHFISYYGKNMSTTLTFLFVSLSYRKGSGQPDVKGHWAQTLFFRGLTITHTEGKVTHTQTHLHSNTYTFTFTFTHTHFWVHTQKLICA